MSSRQGAIQKREGKMERLMQNLLMQQPRKPQIKEILQVSIYGSTEVCNHFMAKTGSCLL